MQTIVIVITITNIKVFLIKKHITVNFYYYYLHRGFVWISKSSRAAGAHPDEVTFSGWWSAALTLLEHTKNKRISNFHRRVPIDLVMCSLITWCVTCTYFSHLMIGCGVQLELSSLSRSKLAALSMDPASAGAVSNIVTSLWRRRVTNNTHWQPDTCSLVSLPLNLVALSGFAFEKAASLSQIDYADCHFARETQNESNFQWKRIVRWDGKYFRGLFSGFDGIWNRRRRQSAEVRHNTTDTLSHFTIH